MKKIEITESEMKEFELFKKSQKKKSIQRSIKNYQSSIKNYQNKIIETKSLLKIERLKLKNI